MSEKLKSLILFFMLCGGIFSFAQMDDSKGIKTLEEKIIENEKLFKKSPDTAFQNLDLLIEEAKDGKNRNAELKLISDRCKYYYLYRTDFEEMVISANELRQKAKEDENHYYEAKAHKYLAQVYIFNKLYDKAIKELQSGLDVLDKGNPNDSLIIIEEGNHYITFANTYTSRGEYFNALRSLKNAVQVHEKFKDPDKLRKAKFLDYANLGTVYLNIDLDSAEYYAKQSLTLGKTGEFPNQYFINYIVLGKTYKEKENYEQALIWFQKAEEIKDNKDFLNIDELYENLIEIYTSLENQTLKEEYENKLKDFRLTIAQNKNNSLVKIISETNQNELPQSTNSKKDKAAYPYLLMVLLLFVMGGILFLWFKYKKEIANRKWNAEPKNKMDAKVYLQLMNLLKTDEQAFLHEFEHVFPLFREKILNLHPDLTKAEVDLLCIMKLGLSVKEISKYKYLSPKTIQNRRNVIRNKMEFSSNDELIRWLNKFPE